MTSPLSHNLLQQSVDSEVHDSADFVGSLVGRFINFLSVPGLVTLIHRAFSHDNPLSTKYAYSLARIARYFDASGVVLRVVIQENLSRVSDPGLLFRTDDITTRILREYTSQIIGDRLLQRFKDVLITLVGPKLSTETIVAKAHQLLQILYDHPFSPEMRWLYEMIFNSISLTFPGFEHHAISGLFFLRYLNPMILKFPSSCMEVNDPGQCQHNSMSLIKVIQAVANGSCGSPRSSSSSNQEKMRDFLSRLGTTEFAGYVSLPSAIPSAAEVNEFFCILSRISGHVAESINSAGPRIPQETVDRWKDFSVEISVIAGHIYQQTPSSLYELTDRLSHPSMKLMLTSNQSRGSHSHRSRSFDGPKSKKHTTSRINPKPKFQQAAIHSTIVEATKPAESVSESVTLVYGLPVASPHISESLFLLTSFPDHLPDLSLLSPSSVQVSSWDNDTVLRWLTINRLEGYIKQFEAENITGDDLVQGSLRFSSFDTQEINRFKTAYGLLLSHTDVFDSTKFSTPEEHICALQMAVIKLAMLANYSFP